MLSSQFAPLFSTSNEWGRTNGEQKSEFGSEMDRFTSNVGAALDSLSCGLELEITEQSVLDNDKSVNISTIIKRLGTEPELCQKIDNLLEGWCGSIEKYLSEPSGDKGLLDVGPKGELDFWRNRMQRLNSVTEQIQSDHCKQIVDILSKASTG